LLHKGRGGGKEDEIRKGSRVPIEERKKQKRGGLKERDILPSVAGRRNGGKKQRKERGENPKEKKRRTCRAATGSIARGFR